MLFNSIEYLLFLISVFLIWRSSPSHNKWIILLIASCIFYCFFIPAYLLILFAIICADYFIALKLENIRSSKMRLLLLILSVTINTGVLIFFKSLSLFVSDGLSNSYNSSELSYLLQNYLLPIGISFHTFQSMSYIIEVYRRKIPAEKHFGYMALYVMFFPQLVAGPIERPDKLLPQLRVTRKVSTEKYVYALKLMLWGFFKKIVIADRFSPIPDAVFATPGNFDGTALALATICFSIQIYCDFSGYTDIARGSAALFGIDLSKNFNRPYFSTSLEIFWKSWHISLSTWFRDYIYIPLGGKNAKYKFFLLLLIFVLSGFWHGFGFTFLLWAVLHALFLWLNKIMIKANFVNPPRVISILITFLIVSLLWVCFRAEHFSDILPIYGKIFTDFHLDTGSISKAIIPLTNNRGAIDYFLVNLVLLLPLILWESGIINKYSKRIYESEIIWMILIIIIVLFGEFNLHNFIYFQF